MANYREEEYFDGSTVTVCMMEVNTFWPSLFFILCTTVFFGLPLAILVVLYSVIACHLMANPGLTQSSSALRYRRQVCGDSAVDEHN